MPDEREERPKRKLTSEVVEECRRILAALEAESVNKRRPGLRARAWRWLRTALSPRL